MVIVYTLYTKWGDIMNTVQNLFCINIKTLRRRYGLNEAQMARVLKLSPEAMEALERGEVTEEVDVGTLLLINGYYGIPPSKMLGEEI